MKINVKKIAAITSSALMLGLTAGSAMAANYPAPFVQSGAGSAAVVYGTGAGVASTDSVQAANIHEDLKSYADSSSSELTTTGETYDLYTSSSKIYMNDTINNVKGTLTDSQLPTVLVDGSFEGDVTADVTQRIDVGSYSRLVFGNHPTSDDDPTVAVKIGTTAGNYAWNDTITFNKAVNFTDSDSIGESLTLFGQEYTVGAGTTTTDLYLYKSSQTLGLSKGGSYPSSQTVSVADSDYTVELVSATDSSATIKVTDSNGDSESKEISEDASKKVQGVDVAVNLADEGTAVGEVTAEVSVGSDKLKFTNGNEVRIGSDEDLIEGTNVVGTYTTGWSDCTGLTIQVYADDTDEDALVEGSEFVDPVFGSIKMGFPELANGENSADRETIEIKNSGSDKATVKFTTHTGDEKTFNWYYNDSTAWRLGGSTGEYIRVFEGDQINETRGDFVVVGNEEKGYLLELKSITNSSDGYGDDSVTFADVFSGKTYESDSASSEGTTSLMIEGEEYTVTYVDDKATANDEYVTLDYPDSSSNDKVVYPSIQTSKGANLIFYEPLNLSLGSDLASGSSLKLPDGDGYTDATLTYVKESTLDSEWNVTGAGLTTGAAASKLNTSSTTAVDLSIGRLTYQLLPEGAVNYTRLVLEDTAGNAITKPAIVLIEEQDDSSNTYYHAQIVKMEGKGTSTDGVGVTDVEATWGSDATWDDKQLASDTDLYKDMDYWGTIVTTDRSESDQYTATISYPDNQVYPKVYIGEAGATTTSSASDEELGVLMVTDAEVSSVSDKNLVIVGGSCINSAAATLIGGALCESDFTDATGVGAGQYMIKGYSDSSLTSELALVVAGYSAVDTVNAASYLRTQMPDTSKSWIGSTATEASAQVEAA